MTIEKAITQYHLKKQNDFYESYKNIIHEGHKTTTVTLDNFGSHFMGDGNTFCLNIETIDHENTYYDERHEIAIPCKSCVSVQLHRTSEVEHEI